MKHENTLITIRGTHFSAAIATRGAELQSLCRLSDGREFIWQRDPKYWEDSSPMLFPICGRLNNSRYTFEGKEYEMTMHGFLPTLLPYDVKIDGASATLFFCDNDETRAQYPFRFELTVTYTLTELGVRVALAVENRDERTMYYAAGAHPGFALPLREGATLEEHTVVFPEAANVRQAMIDDDGLFTGELVEYALTDKSIHLAESQFAIDGIFLANVGSTVELHCEGADTFVRVCCEGNDVTGIWKEYGADAKFLCLEPWCGYPSIAGQKDRLDEKFGMYSLDVGKTGTFVYTIELPTEAK